MDHIIELFSQPQTYISLGTLTLMEIVLGIDNIIFISIIAGRLPKREQKKARTIGLSLALIFRIALLAGISWIVGMVEPIFTIGNTGVSGRDIILIAGGLFLLTKSTSEIHHKIEGDESDGKRKGKNTFGSVVFQIVILDMVFSFDSVITAVGLVDSLTIMVTAVIISMIVMLIFAGTVSDFVNKHPTIKMLALAFLLMIGTLLVAEGFHFHLPRGYVYFAMAFSIFVELLNMKIRKNAES